jgi:cation diffusion facilitator family transporter
MESLMSDKVNTAKLSILSNTLLIILKLIAGVMSGSVSIISEAIHSTMDLLAAVIAFFSVKIADHKPDEKHPYGHGKFENVSGVIEAALIFVASIWIIYEAVMKMVHGGEIKVPIVGIAVMLISAVVNTLVAAKLYRVAKQTNSIALEADALHLKADVYTSLGVAGGLFILFIGDIFKWNLQIVDPIVAILVALFILHEAYELLEKAYAPLLDISFSSEELGSLKTVIEKHGFAYHKLRTRKAGSYNFIDFHLLFPKTYNISEAHDASEAIKTDIRSYFENIDVTIHLEPDDQKNREHYNS